MSTENTEENLPPAPTSHLNADLFIWALALVGGGEGYVDVEDVYYKCFELSPKRFSWRTRPDLPDRTRGSEARRDLIKRQKKLGIIMIDALEVDVTEGKPASSFNWRLTSLGRKWCEMHKDKLSELYGGGHIPVAHTRIESRKIQELKKSTLFEQWQSGALSKPLIVEIASLFECSPASEK